MVDYDKKIVKQAGKKRLAHYWVTCDRCGHGRWLAAGVIQQLQSPHHHCKGCTVFLRAQKRILVEFPSAVYDNGKWKAPVICPDCKRVRSVRLFRARRWGGKRLCKICARRQIGYSSKVGIRDENGKTCPKCLVYKLYSEYYKSSREKDGVQCYCKECDKIHKRRSMRARIARKRGNGGSFTANQWESLCIKYGSVCIACGRCLPLQADHIVPVSLGGTSYIDNIQPLCAECNGRKRAKIIDYCPDAYWADWT